MQKFSINSVELAKRVGEINWKIRHLQLKECKVWRLNFNQSLDGEICNLTNIF